MDSDASSNSFTSDRPAFVVGLCAAVLALLPFKESAEAIRVQLLFGWSPSLYALAGIFLGMLILSAYFFGLNQIRYSFPTLLQFEWLKILDIAAQVFYTITFLLPLIVFLIWGISTLISSFSLRFVDLAMIVSNTAGVTAAIATTVVSLFQIKIRRNTLIEESKDIQTSSALQTYEIYKKGDATMFLLSLFQSVMLAINTVLIQKLGVEARRLPSVVAIKIAHDKKILTHKETSSITELRELRNLIAHDLGSAHIITKERAMLLYEQILPILKKLENMSAVPE
jgi:hypothetical protein